MTEPLNIIALISGGKDSFFSILHCLQNGHQVVALANLYPPEADAAEEHDLNSFMYQTVGHTVIPLYEQALGIPLYRQVIVGGAVQTGTSYGFIEGEEMKDEVDETESLIPLLRRIMRDHPGANALSTGAILSTYQRTRIESIALRLKLIPLSFLWQYPVLPPGTQISLLQDMNTVGLDARIIKVASGGLDESFLWENVASVKGMERVERAMRRFGVDGDGAVIGEGGEFETLVVAGPESLFKGRIVVKEEDRRVVSEGGGSAWLRIRKAEVVMKDTPEDQKVGVRIPPLLEERFEDILRLLNTEDENTSLRLPSKDPTPFQSSNTSQALFTPQKARQDILYWTTHLDPSTSRPSLSIAEEASLLISQIRHRLTKSSLQSTSIISTTIILRSMSDFTTINPIYSTLFTSPNPPSRVTIASGSSMPHGIKILIHMKIHHPPSSQTSARKALHVQSRSYWAPANIGPYSQAISIPIPISSKPQDEDEYTPTYEVHTAGQIPLIPHAMTLPSSPSSFPFETVLALQHLHRISRETHIRWWTSAVVYLPTTTSSSLPLATRAALAFRAWTLLHTPPSQSPLIEESEPPSPPPDLYPHFLPRPQTHRTHPLPDFSLLTTHLPPPLFAISISSLPLFSNLEWHSHTGLSGTSPIHTSSLHNKDFTIHQYTFTSITSTIIAISFLPSRNEVQLVLTKALSISNPDKTKELESHTAYVDMHVRDIWDLEGCEAKVPCSGIWAEGGRMAAVLLFSGRT